MNAILLKGSDGVRKNFRSDAVLLTGWTLAVICSMFLIEVRPYISTFLYFVAPTAYLLWKGQLNRMRIFLGAAFIGLVISFPLDFLANLNRAWHVPDHQLLIPLRVFGVVPIDELVWFFFFALYIISFYEYFVDRERTLRLSKRISFGFSFFAILAFGVVVLFLAVPHLLLLPYAYLFIAFGFGLPPIVFLLNKKPQLLGKLSWTAIYFFFVSLGFELTAVRSGQWIFPGQYIGTITLFDITFAFEEFLSYILLYPPMTIAYYELFVDDEK